MKPSRFFLYALLLIAFFCWWQLVISIQQSNVRVNDTPIVSHRPAIDSGILSDPNFQKVLQAMQQRTGTQELAEPRVTTVYAGTINRSYYNQTFTLPVTSRIQQP